jgi:hypothetical protein
MEAHMEILAIDLKVGKRNIFLHPISPQKDHIQIMSEEMEISVKGTSPLGGEYDEAILGSTFGACTDRASSVQT